VRDPERTEVAHAPESVRRWVHPSPPDTAWHSTQKSAKEQDSTGGGRQAIAACACGVTSTLTIATNATIHFSLI
jgi:hypothetical protein